MQKLPVTKIVDALMESKSMAEVDDYRYFDPKLLRPADRLIYVVVVGVASTLKYNILLKNKDSVIDYVHFNVKLILEID